MNCFLLDTHVFLWFIMGDSRLNAKVRGYLEEDECRVFVSLATMWEIGIKVSMGKLHLGKPFDVLIPEQLAVNGFELLDIKLEHISRLLTLPFFHRDPFDRLLIAQSIWEDVPVISQDSAFDAYPVQRIWH